MFVHSDLQWFPRITMGQLCLLTNSLLRHWVKGMCSMMDMLTVLHFGIKDLEFSNLNKSWVLFLFPPLIQQINCPSGFHFPPPHVKLTYHQLGFLTRGRYTNSDEAGTQIWHMCLTTFGYIALAQAATSAQDIVLRKSISDRDEVFTGYRMCRRNAGSFWGLGKVRREGNRGRPNWNLLLGFGP
jgi:hypothetical protein